jgi:CDP-diacylglycerol--serine O-phosphatidyltransferase
MILYQFLRMSFMRQANGADVSMILLLPALVLPCAAAIRLARFNLDETQSHSFKGIPVPAVGLLIASFPLIYWTKNSNWVINILLNKWFIYGLVLLLSYGMISRFPVMAMKFNKAAAGQRVPRMLLLLIALVSLYFFHWLAVPVVFLFYIVLSLAFKNRIV